ncbi:uncharacterized protein [Apostichopus japonicus]|uniref:uncharacterized protein n=1 Tax=Stichopus japonicus TaxID=307972 RepID=UPI003AB37334
MSKSAMKDLQRQLDALAESLEHEKAKREEKLAEREAPNTVYVLEKERKIRAFSGTEGPSVSSFQEDIQAALKVRRLSDTDAADFILAHLEGAARQEMRHQPSEVTLDPDLILQKLSDTFGDRRTLGSLMREMCNKVQREEETIAEFAFKLMSLADQLKKVPGAPDAEQAIKEQFRDGLLDGVLRREIKKALIQDPDVSFIKLRDWALDMAEEDRDLPRRRVRKPVSAVEAETTQITKALVDLTTAVKSQAEVMEALQIQQSGILSRLDKLEAQNTRPARIPKKDLRCHRCQKIGHLARECRSPAPLSPAVTQHQEN